MFDRLPAIPLTIEPERPALLDLSLIEVRVMASMIAGNIRPDPYTLLAAEWGMTRSEAKEAAYLRGYNAADVGLTRHLADIRRQMNPKRVRKSKGWRRHLRRVKARAR